MKIKHCEKCNVEIFKITADNGKPFICESTPILYWQNKRGKHKIITPNGEQINCNLNGDIHKATGYGYLVHNCQKATTTA